jgi:uncharacterized membrane protein HdeD (DUF308 family)
MTMSNDTPAALPPRIGLFGELEKNWGWLMTFGIASIILGSIGLGMSFVLTLASMVFFGALLVAGGVFQILDALKCRGWKGTILHVLIGLLYVVGGVIVMIDPVFASETFTLVLAGVLIAVGLMRLIMAFQMRRAKGWYWPLISGLVSLALGAVILAQWPASSLFVIGLIIAIELIFNGWAYVFVALAARAAGKAGPEEAS